MRHINTGNSASQPGKFIATERETVNEYTVPNGLASVQLRSRLPHSMHQGFGKKLKVEHLPHFCSTSLPFLAAVQNGRVRSVIWGSGLPAFALVTVRPRFRKSSRCRCGRD